MNYWLAKGDPQDYGYDDLERDKRTVWDGVRNNQALQFLRQMKRGDQVLVYHSGKEKRVVGLAEVVRGPYADPDADDDKLVVVDLRAHRRVPRPVALADIKADARLADLHLVRMSRLSVMPVAKPQWKRLLELAGVAGE